jgi:hypothetical protein
MIHINVSTITIILRHLFIDGWVWIEAVGK